MADHKSAKKRIRRNERRAVINGTRRNRIRTLIKKVEHALGEENHEKAASALKVAQPEILRGVSKGILHKNTAARRISRLSARIKALQTSV